MTTEILSVNVTAGEIIAVGGTLELTLSASVDPKSAQGAIRVSCERDPIAVRVDVKKRGRVIVVNLHDTTVGACELVVSELLSTKGERLVDYFFLPFTVLPISDQVTAELRVEHVMRLIFGELQVERLSLNETPAGYVDVLKAIDRKSGEPRELAFDEQAEPIDVVEQFAQVARRRGERFGRLHETLHELIEHGQESERIPIIVWPRFELPPAPYEKPSDRRSVEPPDDEAQIAEALRQPATELRASVERLNVQLVRDEQPDEAVPYVRATATIDQIRRLADDDAVGVILFDDPSAIPDLGNSIAVARSDAAQLGGFDGTDVRVAVWEDGPSVTTNLTFAGRFTTTPPASDHARLTTAIVRNTEANKPHGHAPDCDLYSANTQSVDALRWAVRDQHCTVVSQSFHRSSEPSGSGLQADDLLKDWLALRWPYPTIVQAAGNFWNGDPDGINPPENEFVNHKGFNSLAVGNHDDTAGAMSGDSVFRNPTSTHSDRELPELAANGTGVSANQQTMSGTSFAAPAVAGVTALLQDVDSVLCSWPEGCRAILLASAGRNIRDNTWWNDVVGGVDSRDGAGAVDAQAGVTVAQQRRSPNATPTRHGWDVGTLSSSVVGPDRLATFRYRISVPNQLLLPSVKVALAWDSAVTSSGDTATASTLTVDLDLLVSDSHGTQVALAASWDNSYEIVDFAATPGETYEIIIRRWSGTDSVWYGVAWTVTGS